MQEERRAENIVFSGKMSYYANVTTVLYLGCEIMPLIWKSRAEATLSIVGSSPPKEVRRTPIARASLREEVCKHKVLEM